MHPQTSSDQEPIVACASGKQASAIAVIRLTGEGCHNIVKKCLHSKVKNFTPKKMHLVELVDPFNGKVIDDPMVAFFSGPKSYTGQDCVELYVHGGPFIIQKTIETLISQGARAAEPGEFTRRAYLNQKLDLTTAEGIRALTQATSEGQWIAARQLAKGQLKAAIDDLRERLLKANGWLAARIDFPDEAETSAVMQEEVVERVQAVQAAIKKLLSTFQSGQIAKDGFRLALIGPPNAGKSTLLNSFLGHERAIVTDEAGTTRDYLEESCLLDGRLIKVVDTAGIRKSTNKVEQIGIERSKEMASQADGILLLLPADSKEEQIQQAERWLDDSDCSHVFYLKTKSDLDTENTNWTKFASQHDLFEISCITGNGLDRLRNTLCSVVDSHIAKVENDISISSIRHKQALQNALASLAGFQKALTEDAYEEMLAFELSEATVALNQIVGEVSADDILGVVFSSFCVGK